MELLADRMANELAGHSCFRGFSLGGLGGEIIPQFSSHAHETPSTMVFIQSQEKFNLSPLCIPLSFFYMHKHMLEGRITGPVSLSLSFILCVDLYLD